MAIKPGTYCEVTLVNTSIESLLAQKDTVGQLTICQNNYLVFESNDKSTPLIANLSLGDFSVPSSNELWIRCDDGEATFRRPYGNPLWDCEKS